MSPYEFLGVSEGTSKAVLKKAYLNKIREYHPDLHPGDEYALEMTKKINEAYQAILKNSVFNYNFEQKIDYRNYDELSKRKGDCCGKISAFKYVDINEYYRRVDLCGSAEEIWKVYEEAKRENLQILLRQVRLKILALGFMDKIEKEAFISKIAQAVVNSNANYDDVLIGIIESIFLDSVRRNAILGIGKLKFLNDEDRNEYVQMINISDIEGINNTLSEAIFESYKKGAIQSINDLDYLSNRDRMDYLSSIDMVYSVEQLRDIFARAKAHNEANRDNRLSARFEKFLSSVFEPKEVEVSRGRRM